MVDYIAHRLTIRPELRTKESIDTTATSSTASSVSNFDEDEESDAPGSPSKTAAVFSGVKRGFKKLGSFSRDSRRSPAPSADEPFSARALDFFHFPPAHSVEQYEQSGAALTPSTAILEKPLPQPPPQLPLDDLLQLDLDFRGTTFPSSRSLVESPETIMDARGTLHDRSISQASSTLDGHTSQSSIASSSREEDNQNNMSTSQGTPSPSIALSPSQPRSAGVMPVAAANPSQHLSGLMCNVHRTTGCEPHARVGSTTTIVGDKLYVFGGRVLSRSAPVLTNALYELDLVRRHWTKLETNGTPPPPRYFHSVCALGDTKLVCYGGMSPVESSLAQSVSPSLDTQPEVVVMSDLHIYDIATKTWTYIPTIETPQGRYAHCATILPSSATFSATNTPSSILNSNQGSSQPGQTAPTTNTEGAGGAEMVVVGGQDSANHYIEQVSVFNLRSLKWTSTSPLDKSCGAYRSVIAPIPSHVASQIGKTAAVSDGQPGSAADVKDTGSSMLIYSNYNFLDVKLELQIRGPDGSLSEKPMQGTYTPPGLRFPNGGIIDTNFIVSGTYLTSSKQEYALWALDLKTLTWSRIDAGGTVFSQGSWNRGVLWGRRNTFVILGNRKRSLVADYNHRRLNFSNVCMVELEAFGLYDNPRKMMPTSAFHSASSPSYASPPPSTSLPPRPGSWTAGGRTLSRAAEDLGTYAFGMKEVADMDILASGGERIPVNSRLIARRWGPYFIQLLREGTYTQEASMSPTQPQMSNIPRLPSQTALPAHNPRNSSITITPSFDMSHSPSLSRQTTLNESPPTSRSSTTSSFHASTIFTPPTPASLPPLHRPRTLYLPHTYLTLHSLLHYLYTSSLPPPNSPLCTPQILYSLLQLARPYRIDGLVEAVVERLHAVLDGRNAAAVFNAAAMAAGGGRGLGESDAFMRDLWKDEGAGKRGHGRSVSLVTVSTQATDDTEEGEGGEAEGSVGVGGRRKKVWEGEGSVVIGLQKRGLRGLMEGRRLRERGSGGGSIGGSGGAGGGGGGGG